MSSILYYIQLRWLFPDFFNDFLWSFQIYMMYAVAVGLLLQLPIAIAMVRWYRKRNSVEEDKMPGHGGTRAIMGDAQELFTHMFQLHRFAQNSFKTLGAYYRTWLYFTPIVTVHDVGDVHRMLVSEWDSFDRSDLEIAPM